MAASFSLEHFGLPSDLRRGGRRGHCWSLRETLRERVGSDELINIFGQSLAQAVDLVVDKPVPGGTELGLGGGGQVESQRVLGARLPSPSWVFFFPSQGFTLSGN